jgi:hypothetical protein
MCERVGCGGGPTVAPGAGAVVGRSGDPGLLLKRWRSSDLLLEEEARLVAAQEDAPPSGR